MLPHIHAIWATPNAIAVFRNCAITLSPLVQSIYCDSGPIQSGFLPTLPVKTILSIPFPRRRRRVYPPTVSAHREAGAPSIWKWPCAAEGA
ncbi:MAG TPA: hypothetical protein VF798_02695, partial [Burkholderiaceae bacterium]